jgi:hypothetical protein
MPASRHQLQLKDRQLSNLSGGRLAQLDALGNQKRLNKPQHIPASNKFS